MTKSSFIPYSRPCIQDDDIQAVVKVLKSDYLTTGPMVQKFEKALASYCGARYAVVCANGTAALHLACMALGLKEKETIITSPITFLATANCACYVGAEVLFCDVDGATVNLDPVKLKETLKQSRQRVKAVFPVHFAGQPADMEAIHKAVKGKEIKIVEDAAHALGATYRTKKGEVVRVGSCRHSDMTIFSFHPVKQITTGEGGAITTNDEKLYRRLVLLRNHGMRKESFTNKALAYTQGKVNPWYYEMSEPGYNYRITDIQCALGLSQLKKSSRFLKKRRAIAAFYDRSFKGLSSIETPPKTKDASSSYHLYVLRFDFKKIGSTRREVMERLKKKGIGTQVHYIPLAHQPYYQKRYGLRRGDFPCSEKYYEGALSIPLYPSMTKSDAARVAKAVKKVCSGVY